MTTEQAIISRMDKLTDVVEGILKVLRELNEVVEKLEQQNDEIIEKLANVSTPSDGGYDFYR